MIYRAELNCLSCGYEIGEIEGRRNDTPENLIFLAVHQGDRLIVDRSGQFRCPRCQSRVLPQGVVPVRRPLAPGSTVEGDLSKELNKRIAS